MKCSSLFLRIFVGSFQKSLEFVFCLPFSSLFFAREITRNFSFIYARCAFLFLLCRLIFFFLKRFLRILCSTLSRLSLFFFFGDKINKAQYSERIQVLLDRSLLAIPENKRQLIVGNFPSAFHLLLTN